MRSPNNDPAHLKNRVIASVYIFRSLPSYYFEDIVHTQETKNKLNYIINNLIQDGYLKRKSTLRKQVQFLLLTKKGHDFVTKQIFKNAGQPFYVYRTDRSIRFTDSDHRFMNFVYIWNWLSQNATLLNKGIQIYEDTNRNYCKIKFAYAGEDVLLYPDILILLPDNEKGSEFKRALIIENDTGSESSKKLFSKFVEYAAYARWGIDQGIIARIDVTFILHSKNRADKLLAKLTSHAKNYNSTLKVKDVKVNDLLQVFSKNNAKFSFSAMQTGYEKQIYETLRYDLKKELLARDPSWQYLI